MSAKATHTVIFHPSGRGAAQCPADPRYPKGVDIDARNKEGQRSCEVELPYPAPECGLWLLKCGDCGFTLAITATGRADDPRHLILPCDDEALAAKSKAEN